MSGICAILDRADGPRGVAPAEERLCAMLERLAHRGPDGMGLTVDGPCGLGQALLATTEQEQSLRRPIWGAGRRLLVAADARIDNRDELFGLGSCAGRPCAEVSDAELLLSAYERWGERCAERIVGDFAFVVWDRDRGRLFAARDPIGVRPLYYHADTLEFRCASEMHALFADGRLERRAHLPSLALYLAGQYEEHDQTLYDGVLALAPGHILAVDDRTIVVRRHWAPDGWRVTRYRNDREHAEHFRAVLTEAVRSRLRSRGPIAAEVSGGLDSSSVVGLSEDLRRSGRGRADPVRLVTMRYTEWPGCDEGEWARAVAAHWELELETVWANGQPERRAPRLENVPPDFLYDVGLLDGLREFEHCRRRGYRVILTGIGGDEIMRQTGLEIPSCLRAGRVGAAMDIAGVGLAPWSVAAWRSLLRAVPTALAPRLRERLGRIVGMRARRAPEWLTAPSAEQVEATLSARDAKRQQLSYRGPARRWRCEHLAFTRDIQPSLGLVELLAARSGLELRHPFFDRRVMDHLVSLPEEQLAGNRLNKPVLRRALGRDLPAAIHARRTQQETSCYYERAFLADHQKEVRSLLRTSQLERVGLIDGRRVRSLLESPPHFVHDLHAIISLELWLRHALRAGRAEQASETIHGHRAQRTYPSSPRR